MADASELFTGVNSHLWVLIFGIGIAWATVRLPYASIARILKWLALFLFAYVVTAVSWGRTGGRFLRATFFPTVRC